MKERPFRPTKNVSNINVMDIPSYDNGTGYKPTPPAMAIRPGPGRRPELHVPLRVTSQQVSHGHFSPQSCYTATPPTLSRKPKFSATHLTTLPPAPGMVKYMDRPLPPRPLAAATAAKITGVSKATVNVNKPLPAVPRNDSNIVKPIPNGIYTSTGQRVNGVVEKSSFSSTTSSSRDAHRKQLRNKAIRNFGGILLTTTEEKKVTKAPTLTKTQITVGKPNQPPNDIRRKPVGSGDNSRSHGDVASEARLAAARQMIARGRIGLYKSAWDTPQWQALTVRERAIIKHELEMESGRRMQERSGKNKKSSMCVVM